MQSRISDGPKLKIRKIEMRTHAHATESIEKVKNAFRNLLKMPIQEDDFNIEHLTGSFSNQLRVITLYFSVQEAIKNIIICLSNLMNIGDKHVLNERLIKHIDEKYRFYIRIEKQAAYLGRFQLANSPDVIQIIITIQNKTPNINLDIENIKLYLQSVQII